MKHDDAVMRLLTLYNAESKYDKSIKILNTRHFHLWEGGGQVHDIYADSHILKGMQFLKRKQYKEAIREFDLANQYPSNLEVASFTQWRLRSQDLLFIRHCIRMQ